MSYYKCNGKDILFNPFELSNEYTTLEQLKHVFDTIYNAYGENLKNGSPHTKYMDYRMFTVYGMDGKQYKIKRGDESDMLFEEHLATYYKETGWTFKSTYHHTINCEGLYIRKKTKVSWNVADHYRTSVIYSVREGHTGSFINLFHMSSEDRNLNNGFDIIVDEGKEKTLEKNSFNVPFTLINNTKEDGTITLAFKKKYSRDVIEVICVSKGEKNCYAPRYIRLRIDIPDRKNDPDFMTFNEIILHVVLDTRSKFSINLIKQYKHTVEVIKKL